MTPSEASGKYKWFSNNVTGGWFNNGIICFGKQSGVAAGQKFTYSFKLGQAKNFVNLGSGVSVLGSTPIDENGNVLTSASTPSPTDSSASAQSDGANSDNTQLTACTDQTSIAYISPNVPTQGGSYTIRLTVKNKNGTVAWTNDSLVLNAKTGIESGSNFFTNPPNIYFTSDTYSYLSPSSGVIGYTSSGNPRNACLLIFDIAVKAGRTDRPIYAADLITSAQQGSFGANIRSIIGNGAIPTAIKCSPWVATYLW